MAEYTLSSRLQFRRDTSEQWVSTNPVLLDGELGYETNTGKAKIGNGSQPWNELKYALVPSYVASVFGRTGEVMAEAGDYTAEQVGADAAGSAAAVQDLLTTHTDDSDIHVTTTEKQTWNNPPVSSVFGRTGAVTAQSGDYTAAQVGALPSSGGTLTGEVGLFSYREKTVNLTGTAIDPTTGCIFLKTLMSDTAFSFSGTLASGYAYSLVLVLSTGETIYSVTWPDTVTWMGGELTFEANKIYEIVLRTYDSGTHWIASCGGGV